MFEDDYRDEDEEYEDDYFEHIDDDEEDENALWDDKDTADTEIADPPDKPRRKRKKKDIEDSSDESYPEEVEAESAEQAQRQIALEQNIIDRLEADAKNIPLRTMPEMRNRNERSSNGSCGQKPLPVWRMPPEHNGILKR